MSKNEKNSTLTVRVRQCSLCESTDYERIMVGSEDGYSACCNEPMDMVEVPA